MYSQERDEKIIQFMKKYYVFTVLEIASFGCIISFGYTFDTAIWWKIGVVTALVAAYHYALIWLDRIVRPKK